MGDKDRLYTAAVITVWPSYLTRFLVDRRQTAPYSPELELDVVLTQPHASGVEDLHTLWQSPKVAAFRCTGKQPGLGGIKHLRPVIAPVADGRVSRFHNHLVRVVGMEKVERRARVASFVVDA